MERTGTPYCALLKSTVSCLLLLMLVVIGNTEGAFAPLFQLPHPHRQEQRRGQLLGDEDSVFPIRYFYQRWGAAIAIER